MKLKLYFLIVLFFNFCLLTKTTGQIFRDHHYKTENFNLNSPALSERIKELRFGKEEKANQGLKLNYSLMKQGVSPNAELIGSSKDFDIYQLPLDKMLCLVPNELYYLNMSTIKERSTKSKGLDPNDNMPNPFKKQELIPLNN